MKYYCPRADFSGLFEICRAANSGIIVITGDGDACKDAVMDAVARSLFEAKPFAHFREQDDYSVTRPPGHRNPLLVGHLDKDIAVHLANDTMGMGHVVLATASGDTEGAITSLLKMGLSHDLVTPGSVFINCRLNRAVGFDCQAPIPLEYCQRMNGSSPGFAALVERLKAKADGRNIWKVMFEGFGNSIDVSNASEAEFYNSHFKKRYSREKIAMVHTTEGGRDYPFPELQPRPRQFWTFEVLVVEDFSGADAFEYSNLYTHREQALNAVFDGLMCPDEFELQYGEI